MQFSNGNYTFIIFYLQKIFVFLLSSNMMNKEKIALFIKNITYN